jgi:cytochrome c oxidase assembly protein subunit 15
MIAVASLLVFRALQTKHVAVSPAIFRTATPIAAVGALVVVIGVLVTGAGPHSGDANSVRNGLDLELWQHVHSYPAYLLLVLVLIQSILLKLRDLKLAIWDVQFKVSAALLVLVIAQAVVGVVQSRLGVPPVLVALHMLGAASLCSLLTFQWLVIRGRSTPTNV